MAQDNPKRSAALKTAETGLAAVGGAAGVTALFSAAACCVLPLSLAALGLGAGGLAVFVPYHWPLTIMAGLAVAAGWLLYLRRRRAFVRGSACADGPASRATLVLLCIATAASAISAAWPRFIERPLITLVGGA